MQRFLHACGGVDFADLDHADVPQRGLPAARPPRPVQIHPHAAQGHNGLAGGLASATSHRHHRLPQHRGLGQRCFQTPGLIGQSPVLAGPNHQFHPMLLANLERLIKVRLPIRHIDPSAATRWPTGGFNPGCPRLRFARPAQPFFSRFPRRRWPRTATLLVEQSHHRAFRSLLQRPGFDAHCQRTM